MDTNLTVSSGTPSAIRQHYYARKIKMYILGLILMTIVFGFYGVENYLNFSDKKAIAQQSQQFLDDATKTRSAENDVFVAAQQDAKPVLDKIDQQLDTVFPKSQNYTELTRVLDSFFKKHNRANDPIIATDLQFDQPHADPNNQFLILPFTVNIESSEANFYRFLAYIESSGTLSGNVRLMDIQSIQMNFPTEDQGDSDASTGGGKADKTIRFTARLQAYSQMNDQDSPQQ